MSLSKKINDVGRCDYYGTEVPVLSGELLWEILTQSFLRKVLLLVPNAYTHLQNDSPAHNQYSLQSQALQRIPVKIRVWFGSDTIVAGVRRISEKGKDSQNESTCRSYLH